MPIKLFEDGDILTHTDVNTYFMDQALCVFADAEERDDSFGNDIDGFPELAPGRICYLLSDRKIYIYTKTSTDPDPEVFEWTPQLALIEDDAVTEVKILNEAVTTAKIDDGAVTTAKLASSLSLTTPTLGVASATSINKVAFTAPASGATLTLADGSTFAISGAYSVTLTASGATAITLPTTGTLATIAGSETLTNKTLTSPVITSPTITGFTLGDSSIVFEGATANDFETTLTVVDPTSDRTITLPNVSGTVVTTGDTATVSETMINYTTVPKQTVSNLNPSGGKQHDIWIKVA